jgi:hypothetical protein
MDALFVLYGIVPQSVYLAAIQKGKKDDIFMQRFQRIPKILWGVQK